MIKTGTMQLTACPLKFIVYFYVPLHHQLYTSHGSIASLLIPAISFMYIYSLYTINSFITMQPVMELGLVQLCQHNFEHNRMAKISCSYNASIIDKIL